MTTVTPKMGKVWKGIGVVRQTGDLKLDGRVGVGGDENRFCVCGENGHAHGFFSVTTLFMPCDTPPAIVFLLKSVVNQ